MLKRFKTNWYAYITGFLLLLQFFFLFSPLHEASMNSVYVWPFTWCALTMLFVTHFRTLPKYTYFSFGFAFWLFVTQVLSGDPYLVYNQSFVLNILLTFGLMFPFMSTVQVCKQEAMFSKMLTLYLAIVVSICFVSLYSVLTNTLFYSPFADIPLGLMEHSYLWLFHMYPSEASPAFVMAFCALLFLALSTPKKWVKVLCLLSCLAVYCALALTVCRTGMIMFSLSVAAFVYVLLFTLFRKKAKPIVSFLGSAPIALLIAFWVFVSFTPTIEYLSRLNEQAKIATQISMNAVISEENDTAPEEIAPVEATTDLRKNDFLEDLSSFTARDQIWQSAFSYLQTRPITLLTGQLDSVVSRLPSSLLGKPRVFHFHNAWIETLLLGGIPGFLLYLGLWLCIFWGSLRLIFGANLTMAKRFLGFVPFVLFLNTLVEIYPTYQCTFVDLFCFLLCGAVVCFANAHTNAIKQAK